MREKRRASSGQEKWILGILARNLNTKQRKAVTRILRETSEVRRVHYIIRDAHDNYNMRSQRSYCIRSNIYIHYCLSCRTGLLKTLLGSPLGFGGISGSPLNGRYAHLHCLTCVLIKANIATLRNQLSRSFHLHCMQDRSCSYFMCHFRV
jgi:hypothetical protein